VSEWPPIAEQELLDRLAMDEQQFAEYIRVLFAKIPPRAFEGAVLERALGYPWGRPEGSYRLTSAGAEPLAEMSDEEREGAIAEFTSEGGGRVPVLAIGSNAAPETLALKFAHFPDGDDREVLALTGRLHDFDVGAAAQPALYGSMPATLFPSPGTEVGATLLWVTPAQLTQLAWSELNYLLGKLGARFDVDEGGESFDEVLVFVSRFGAFRVDGRPVALAAVPANRRTAVALTQEQLLDAAAALAIGPEAKAETLVRAIFEGISEIGPKFASTVNRESLPFESCRFRRFPTRGLTQLGLPTGCTLRVAGAADAEALARLVDDAYGHYVERLGKPPGPMRDDYAEVIRDRDVTVVESEGAIVAAIALGVSEQGFTIDNVAVHPSRQGEGLGRALLELAEEEARRQGFDSIHLYTHEKMTENLAFYASIGYAEYERREGDGFSRVFMRKRLDVD
jgi:ribosomal protein S18 acetylase RimI-like enzyme